MPSDFAHSRTTRSGSMPRKDKDKDKDEVTPDTSTWSKANPHLTAVMPGAVMDHDQARLLERERTAALNGQGADAVVISVGASAGVTSDVSPPVSSASSAGTTPTSSSSVAPSPSS